MTLPTFSNITAKIKMSVGQDPPRDWYLLIGLSAVAFVLISVWSLWVFGTIADGGVIGPSIGSHAVQFDTSSLSTIRAVFESRSTEEQKYATGVYQFADPSQ